MAGVRKFSAYIGVNKPKLSVRKDFFGIPYDPRESLISTQIGELSLLEQMQRLRWRQFHLNIIVVGAPSKFSEWDQSDLREICGAIQFVRKLFEQVSLALGRVSWHHIPPDQSNGHLDLSDVDEAKDLTSEWTVHNFAIDFFLVRNFNKWGLSPVDGPCDKDGKGMTGAVAETEGLGFLLLGHVMAHEIGHYLGLNHSSDIDNLMFFAGFTAGKLTQGQGGEMKDHCFVWPGCP